MCGVVNRVLEMDRNAVTVQKYNRMYDDCIAKRYPKRRERCMRERKRVMVSASRVCAISQQCSTTHGILASIWQRLHVVHETCMSCALIVWWMLPYVVRRWLREVFSVPTTWPCVNDQRHILTPLSMFLTSTSKVKRRQAESLGIDKLGRSYKVAHTYFQSWMIEELIGMGIPPKSYQTYLQALMHPSALEPGQRHVSYERLEYLGDAVMELAVREMLLERIPTADEGILTFQTQAFVRGDVVSMISAWIGLDKFIMTNVYSMRTSLLQSPSILCDAFEALLGAMYLDKGLGAVKEFLARVYTECPLIDWDQFVLERNYVSDLSRVASELEYNVPQYITMYEDDIPFTVQVFLDGHPQGVGVSHDLRIAKQIAAQSTLDTIHSEVYE